MAEQSWASEFQVVSPFDVACNESLSGGSKEHMKHHHLYHV